MKRNIWLLRCISAVRWFLLIMPVIFLFYRSHGLSLFQTFVIQAFFSLCILIFEVPTGYLGDRFGWNRSLLLGSCSAVLGLLILTQVSHFYLFLLAEMFMAAAYCLFSGSDSALLYETLCDLDREYEYLSEEGTLLASGYISEGVAAIIGGVLAYLSMYLPFVLNFIILLFLIPLTLSLKNPTRKSPLPPVSLEIDGSRCFRRDFMQIFRFIQNEPVVKWVAIYSGFIGFLALSSAWLMQSYFKLTGFELYYIGFIWALLNFSRSLAASRVNIINYRIGTKQLFVMIPFVVAASAFFMGIYVSLVTMLFGLLIQAARGLQLPLVFTIINNRTHSEIRAAVLSFEGMMMRLFFVILGPMLGLLCDYESIHVAFLMIGLLALLGGSLINFKIKSFMQAPGAVPS
ncbi:MAG: hypothetical protein CL816_03790 [Coxiellaceae bacterium]|nr:hypothetical protein [Coxiellaceae bacterium]|tara:strand:- start:1106 stop:2311 length:1206 start_codon:yes stop_codon:yes gene_type:complete